MIGGGGVSEIESILAEAVKFYIYTDKTDETASFASKMDQSCFSEYLLSLLKIITEINLSQNIIKSKN